MRILVIGHGMVGSRFAADLARAESSAEVTVLGQEDLAPYNRVMLSSVVAGKVGTSSLALEAPDPARVRVLRGVRAVRLDRDRREVLDDRGDAHSYDRLVLATGSAPRIPAIPGLRDEHGLLDGVSALKDLADAHRILAVAERARQAVVLGAGVLGLEVATGLAARGISVTLVHHRDRLLERQLDPDASAIMHGALGRLGIGVVTGVQVSGLERAEGRLSGVRLSDGGAHPAQLMVLCTGTLPHLDLAREAGLACEDGILVGEDLAATEDSSVFAIGDCAQPPEGASGLVAQGWEQARRLVAAWTAADAPDSGQESGRGSGPGSSRGSASAAEARPVPAVSSGRERDLVRVKTVGLPLVTMGRIDRPGTSPHAPRSVRLSDPVGGRYTEVVVHDGRLIAATVIGDEEAAASLSAAFTQHTPVPLDPIHLLARPLPGGSAPVPSPQGTAEEDVVCRCNGVTRGTLCAAVRAGCGSMAEISARTRAGTGCGTCRSRIAELLEGETAAVPLPV